MSDLTKLNFDQMSAAEFEQYLPELFAAGRGRVSEDPRFAQFLAANPDCAALVRDLETIAETAKSLFEPSHEPSETVWANIQGRLNAEGEPETDTVP